jgi:hypothetical protein
MQILRRHNFTNTASDSKFMETLACLCFDSLVSALPSSTDSNSMSLSTAFLLPNNLPANIYNQSQTTLYIPDCTINTASVNECIISIIGCTGYTASDSISYIDKRCVSRSEEIHFYILALPDLSWVIDSERASSFRITIFGLAFPINNGLQVVNSTIHCNSRKRREHMSIGRMTCLLNQHFNL